MPESSFLSCSRTRVRAVPGRTDGFAAALQRFLETIAGRAGSFSYAELLLIADGDEHSFFWLGDECPDLGGNLACLAASAELDVQLNLCSDEDCASDALAALIAPLADGALSDCVRFSSLTRSGDDASVFLLGSSDGAFHHGEIPFRDGLQGVPEDMCWNSCTHAARFTFPEAARDDAWDLSDLLEERIDEIDLDFSRDEGTLAIHSVQLPDAEAVETYRAFLEQLASIAGSASILGALTPEAENAFALLRFVLEDGRVRMQTAIAEI